MSSIEDNNNIALVRKIKKGDEKALQSLYNLYFQRVVNFSFKLLNDKETACEVAQDVFVKIWDMRQTLDEEKSISGLMFRMTKLRSIDALRKRHAGTNLQTLDDPSDSSHARLWEGQHSGEELFIAKEMQQAYEKIIARLPPKRRRIFQMSRDENLTYREIAQKLNISSKTVETQIRLALKQLREELPK